MSAECARPTLNTTWNWVVVLACFGTPPPRTATTVGQFLKFGLHWTWQHHRTDLRAVRSCTVDQRLGVLAFTAVTWARGPLATPCRSACSIVSAEHSVLEGALTSMLCCMCTRKGTYTAWLGTQWVTMHICLPACLPACPRSDLASSRAAVPIGPPIGSARPAVGHSQPLPWKLWLASL